jgi:hypothetical protein
LEVRIPGTKSQRRSDGSGSRSGSWVSSDDGEENQLSFSIHCFLDIPFFRYSFLLSYHELFLFQVGGYD